MKTLMIALAVLATALAGCGGGSASTNASPAVTADVASPAAQPTSSADKFFTRVVRPSNPPQSIQGVTVSINAVGFTTIDKVLAQETAATRSRYSAANSVIVIEFEVYNSSSTTQSIHTYTGSTALVNDEQLDADANLSRFKSELLPGARATMQAVFLPTRYAPDAVRNIRFVLEKSISLDGTGSFDFAIPIN